MKQLAVLCLFSLLATEVYATSLVYKDFNDLVTEADAIVVGSVRSIESHYGEPHPGEPHPGEPHYGEPHPGEPHYGPSRKIYTLVTLEVLDFLYGATDEDPLVIRLDGGQVDGEVQQVIGAPKFQPGERVVLFIRDNGETIVPFVGWTQGVFRIVQDQESGTNVISDHDGNRILGVHGATVRKKRRYQSEAHVVDLEMGGHTGDGQESQTFSTTRQDGHPGWSDDDPVDIDWQAIEEAEDFLDIIAQRLSQGTQTAPPF